MVISLNYLNPQEIIDSQVPWWGTKKQILFLKGRIKKDEEGTFLKIPIKKDFFKVFNLNQTTLKEEKLNELRDSIHPYTIKSTIWEMMD